MPFDPTGFAEAAAESKASEAPPDGLYDAELLEADIATRNSDGIQWVTLTWKIIVGTQRDRTWTSFHTLERFKADGERNAGLAFTVEALRKIGLDVDGVHYPTSDSLRRALEPFTRQGYTIEVKSSGSYTNVYVKGAMSPQAQQASTEYGQQTPSPAQSAPQTSSSGASAIYQGDGPEAQNAPTLAQEARASVDPQPTGESDVPGAAPGEFAPPKDSDDVPWSDRPPQKGDIDPETGLPLLY